MPLQKINRLPQQGKSVAGFCALITLSVIYGQAYATDLDSRNMQNQTQTSVNSSPQTNVLSQNAFDFSSSGGRNTPPAPSLPSFAGGPCLGVGGGLSASGPGFAIGAARGFEDEACQRRNWVQTIIGVSQHMPERDANELKRVAVMLMMQDEFVAPAFEALGHDMSRAQNKPANESSGSTQAPSRSVRPAAAEPARMAQGCEVVVPANASTEFVSLVSARGCRIARR